MTGASSRCQIDHLVVVAADLARGAQEVADRLGVPLEPGGEHPAMATHNRLLRLGDATYLEVIAPSPALPPPARRRWFGLDDVAPGAPARLAAWAVRCDDIARVVGAAAEPLGPIEALSRGALRWQITVPADGGLVLGGAGPMVIAWPPGVEVAQRLTDRDCALHRLELHHPEPERVRTLLRSIALDDERVVVVALPAGAAAHLIAYVATPSGLRVIGTR